MAKQVKAKPKSFWKCAKCRLKTNPIIPALIKSDGLKATTPEEKAEVLNDFYSSVFTVEDEQTIPAPPKYSVVKLLSTVDITPE